MRSLPSVARATSQPLLTSPTTSASGTNTSSKNTSLKCAWPVRPLQRIHCHPRGFHVDRHHRHAGVLGCVGVGADGGQAPLALVRQAGPHLLTGDPPAAVDLLGDGADRRGVRPGARLGEQLAPHHLAAQHRFDPAFALIVVAGLGDGQRDPAGDAHVRALARSALDGTPPRSPTARARRRPGPRACGQCGTRYPESTRKSRLLVRRAATAPWPRPRGPRSGTPRPPRAA